MILIFFNSNRETYKRKKLYDYALAYLALLMPLVVKGFPVLIMIAALTGVLYFFKAYKMLGKPKKAYYLLPINLFKDAFLNILKSKGSFLFMLILFLVYLISTLFFEPSETTTQKIILKSCYLYFPLIFSLTKWDKEKLLRVIDFFIYGCCLQIFLSLANAYWASDFTFVFSEFTYTKLSFNLHPSYAGLVINIGFVFSTLRLLFIYRDTNSIKNNFWRLITLFGFLCYLILLSSKTGIISFLIIFIVLLVYSNFVLRSWKVPLKIASFIAMFFVLFFLFFGGKAANKYNSMVSSIKNRDVLENNKTKKLRSTQIRLVLWKNSLESIKKSNFLGYGLGNGKQQLRKNLKSNNEKFVYGLNLNAHNQYLEIMLSLGLIGLILLSFILINSALGYGSFNWISILLVLTVACNLLFESMMEKQTGSIIIVWLLCFLTSGKSIFKSVFKVQKD